MGITRTKIKRKKNTLMLTLGVRVVAFEQTGCSKLRDAVVAACCCCFWAVLRGGFYFHVMKKIRLHY